MKNVISFLLILSTCYSQKGKTIQYDKLLDGLGGSIRYYSMKSNSTLTINNSTLQIKSDTTLSFLKKIVINDNILNENLIKYGNSDFSNMDDFEFNKTFYFLFQNSTYVYIPLYIKNCHGRSCRYYSCLLIQVNKDKLVNAFFFGNDECEDYFYFKCINKQLAFLNIDSKTNFSLKNDQDDYQYRITMLLFDSKLNKWVKGLDKNRKEIYVSFSTKNHFIKNKVKILNENWKKYYIK